MVFVVFSQVHARDRIGGQALFFTVLLPSVVVLPSTRQQERQRHSSFSRPSGLRREDQWERHECGQWDAGEGQQWLL